MTSTEIEPPRRKPPRKRKRQLTPGEQRKSKRKTPQTRGERNIAWIEAHCYVPEGKHVGEKIKLRGWQKRELIKIYDNPFGTRRAILSFGRKNGKTVLAACLVLLHLCGPEASQNPNSELYSAAQSRDQAAITFDRASKMTRLNPLLHDAIAIHDSTKALHCPELGIKYRALSAEASTNFGLSPRLIIHDELGQICLRKQVKAFQNISFQTAA